MKVETVTVTEVDLRALPYREWPEQAKALARVFLEREMRSSQPDMMLRERIIARIEAWQAQEPFEL